jgi:cytoskeleton protein RodZ
MNEQAGGASAAAGSGSPGELLRKQRERRALSVQQAAEDLHLDASMIEAIEADRFQVLGAPVYAKGHLRKYAMLLGLSPVQVIQLYEALIGTPVVPLPIPASAVTPVRRERRSMKVPLLILLAVVLAAIGWWLYRFLTAPAAVPSDSPGQVAPPAIEPDASSAPAVQTAPEATPSQAAASRVTSQQVETAASSLVATMAAIARSEPSAASTAGEVELTLQFSAASWTEIYDSAGKRLMFDTGAPGMVRTMKGAAPLRVTLGFASAVDARVNGAPVVVPRRAGKDAAKFTVEANGSLR